MPIWMVSRWRISVIAAEAAMAWLTFYADPLGLSDQKQRALSADFAVLTQYLRGPAPKDVAVLLIDKQALEDRATDWPLRYDTVADLIGELRCAHVKAVFFDFTASRVFTAANPEDRLRAAVQGESTARVCADGSAPTEAPAFFGRVAGFETPMGQWLRDRHNTFLLVGGEDSAVYQVSRDTHPSAPVTIGDTTPAFGLMRRRELKLGTQLVDDNSPCDAHDERPKCWRAPLALVWSARYDPAQAKVSDLTACRGDRGWLGTLADLPWPWTDDKRFELCPPVLTLRAADVERDAGYIAEHGDPARQLENRVVFVGADLPGLNDRVSTPIHNTLPGVYKHAVALGTLIAAGARYPTIPPPLTLAVLIAALYLALEAARHGLRRHPRRHWAFAGVCAFSGLAFSAVVYGLDWPPTLLVDVFGYYVAVVGALFAVSRAKTRDERRARAKGGNHAITLRPDPGCGTPAPGRGGGNP